MFTNLPDQMMENLSCFVENCTHLALLNDISYQKVSEYQQVSHPLHNAFPHL